MSNDSAAARTSALRLVLQQLTERKVPGLSVTLMQREHVMMEDADGLADWATKRSTTLDTVYLWFSMTKIVTATPRCSSSSADA